MVYGYFRARERITHMEAYPRPELRCKRMRAGIPNGNIIVDADGRFNRFDGGYHRDRFGEINRYYVIGGTDESELLCEARIRQLAPGFVAILKRVFGTRERSAFGIIGRKGRRTCEEQVTRLLAWPRR
jgi:hypothetical protein